MELNEFLPILNNTTCFYVNKNGLITIDENWHLPLMQLTILYYWERFSKVVGQKKLWFVLGSLRKTDRLLFKADGTPYEPPDVLNDLIKSEREQKIVKDILAHSFSWTTFVVFVLVFIVVVWTAYGLLNIKTYLRAAFTSDSIS